MILDLPPRDSSTVRTLLIGAAIALFMNLYTISLYFEFFWEFAESIPFVWARNTLSVFNTFFHEIGHTLTAWFYGYPTIPMFDFAHGGGWAWSFAGQTYPILFLIIGGLGYLCYLFRGHIWLQGAAATLLLFNLATAFIPFHEVMIFFMGPVSEGLWASFFLTRALFNLAPRGAGERLMNAILGLAMPINTLTYGYALLKHAEVRDRYLHQKGGHAVGDFDQIANRLVRGNFEEVVIVWMIIAAICAIAPFIVYFFFRHRQFTEEN